MFCTVTAAVCGATFACTCSLHDVMFLDITVIILCCVQTGQTGFVQFQVLEEILCTV